MAGRKEVKMKAINIEWSIDMDQVFEKLGELEECEVAKIIKFSPEIFSKMGTAERRDHISSYFHHCPGALYDFLELPEEIEIDYGIAEEDACPYLETSYGYSINMLKIVDTVELGNFSVDVTLQENGMFDVYISHEGNSGEHYTNVTADRIGVILAGDIECIAENYHNEYYTVPKKEVV